MSDSHHIREKQLQGQLHELSMAVAAYDADPSTIGAYLETRKDMLWNGLAELQAEIKEQSDE